MDINTAIDLEVCQHRRQARVAYYLFHMMVRYGCEVIDRVELMRLATGTMTNSPARSSSRSGCYCWVIQKPQERRSAVSFLGSAGCYPVIDDGLFDESRVQNTLVTQHGLGLETGLEALVTTGKANTGFETVR